VNHECQTSQGLLKEGNEDEDCFILGDIEEAKEHIIGFTNFGEIVIPLAKCSILGTLVATLPI
jgi:hypothetical protein